MAKQLPSGFDRARIIAGLHKAMEFGEPTRTSDKATFYKVATVTSEPADDDGVPFNPAAARDVRPRPIRVPCGVEIADHADATETFGTVQSGTAKITLLDDDYQKVKGFAYVVIGGIKYDYRKTDPPVALGSLDIWTVHVVSEDEA